MALRKPAVISIAVLAVLLAAAACAIRWWPGKGSSYQGRSLGFWLSRLANAEAGDGLLMTEAQPWLDAKYPGARAAFVALGPTSVPCLLREIQHKNQPWDPLLVKLSPVLARLGITHTPASIRANRAALALAMSGESVVPHLPELEAAFANPITQRRAAWGLVAAGDAPVTWLCSWLNSESNSPAVADCSWILAQRGEAASNAVPAVLRHLHHPQGVTRSIVAWSVGRMTTDPAILVPALVPLLKDPDRYARNGAAGSLARLGPKAESAVPAFLEAIERAEPGERRYRIQELRQISPEAADKAERAGLRPYF